MMLDVGGIPATLGYRGFTHSCCTSINHVVCHGIPDAKPVREGDIVNIDVTTIIDGWHGDTSRMYLVGDVPIKAKRLVEVTYECLRSEEHTSELQSLMRISYAVFCLKKQNKDTKENTDIIRS